MASRTPKERDFPHRRAVKPEQAGLLWALMGAANRRAAASHLTLLEISRLNDELRRYTGGSREERRAAELALRAALGSALPKWPAAASIVLFLFLLFAIYMQRLILPGMTAGLSADLFTPLFVGCFAPLSLYFLKPWRIRQLFSVSPNAMDSFVTIAAALALVWNQYAVNEQYSGNVFYNPRGFLFFILCSGAVLGPLLEEVLFRELLPSIFGKPPHWTGHALAAVMFSAAHMPPSLFIFFLYALSGAILAALRIQTGRLSHTYAAHAAGNLAFLLLTS